MCGCMTMRARLESLRKWLSKFVGNLASHTPYEAADACYIYCAVPNCIPLVCQVHTLSEVKKARVTSLKM